MLALAEEQRKAGLLLDDGARAPVRLNVSLRTTSESESAVKDKTTVWTGGRGRGHLCVPRD